MYKLELSRNRSIFNMAGASNSTQRAQEMRLHKMRLEKSLVPRMDFRRGGTGWYHQIGILGRLFQVCLLGSSSNLQYSLLTQKNHVSDHLYRSWNMQSHIVYHFNYKYSLYIFVCYLSLSQCSADRKCSKLLTSLVTPESQALSYIPFISPAVSSRVVHS